MLTEILTLVGVSGYALSIGLGQYKSSRDKKKFIETLPDPITAAVPIGDTATLVVELLRSDEGWKSTRTGGTQFRHDTWEHKLGVRIQQTEDYEFARFESILVYVKNDSGAYDHADTSSADDKIILAELKAFKSRQRDAKQRALTRALAGRIVAAERGEVRPVLGGPGVSGDSSTGEDDPFREPDPVPAGLLSYDDASGKIVASLRGDSVCLNLDASLKRRYGRLLGEAKEIEYDMSMYNDLYGIK